MDTLLYFFEHYAHTVVFVWILLESLGAPIAGEVVLLLAGSLMATRQLNPVGVLVSAWAGGMLGDALVFRLGKHMGDESLRRLLGLYCRYTLCSSECFLTTKNCLFRFSAWTIIFARYVLGVRAMTPPLSGMLGYSYRRFAVFDGIGILIWAVLYSLAGWILGNRWHQLSDAVPYVSILPLGLAVCAVLGVLIWKYVRRVRYGPPQMEMKELLPDTLVENDPSLPLSSVRDLHVCTNSDEVVSIKNAER